MENMGLSLGLCGGRNSPFPGSSMFLDFLRPKLDPRVTFTRASSALRYNAQGVLETVGYNLLTYSEDYSNAAWAKVASTISAYSESVIGAATFKQVESATSANHIIQQGYTSVAGTTYTVTRYMKAAERSWAKLEFYNATDGNKNAWFDLQNGVIGNTASGVTAAIVAIGGGWYQCSATYTTAYSGTGCNVNFGTALANGGLNYTGDGVSGIYVGPAQLEVGSKASAYSKTTTAANSGPRFDYDPVTLKPKGLLIEESRTNYFTYSQDAQTAWSVKSNVTVSSDSTTAPDGTQTADTLVENTANGGHYFERSITLAANAPVAYSVYVKNNGRPDIWLNVYANGYADSLRGAYNLNTLATSVANSGTATGATATIQAVGNGWFRLTLSGTPSTAAVTDCKPRINFINGSTTYTGDGVSGCYVWGAQLEAGSFATSYIPTTTAAVTRAADVAVINTLSPWYNATEGTLYSEGSVLSYTTARMLVSIDKGTAGYGPRHQLVGWKANTGVSSYAVVDDASTVVVAGLETGADTTLTKKCAFTYSNNYFKAAANGTLTAPDTSGTPPTTVAQFSIGVDDGGLNYLNGYIRKLAYYPKRLSDVQLQNLTK